MRRKKPKINKFDIYRLYHSSTQIPETRCSLSASEQNMLRTITLEYNKSERSSDAIQLALELAIANYSRNQIVDHQPTKKEIESQFTKFSLDSWAMQDSIIKILNNPFCLEALKMRGLAQKFVEVLKTLNALENDLRSIEKEDVSKLSDHLGPTKLARYVLICSAIHIFYKKISKQVPIDDVTSFVAIALNKVECNFEKKYLRKTIKQLLKNALLRKNFEDYQPNSSELWTDDNPYLICAKLDPK